MSERRRWVERHEYTIRTASSAPPEDVYAVLSDLSSHLEWSGRQLGEKTERLLSMEAPPAPAAAGTEFRSTGWTAIGTFHDRSRVILAEAPFRFEFMTESQLRRPKGQPLMSAFSHRFVIEPDRSGSRITRIIGQPRFYDPAPWWLRILAWPLIAQLGFRLMAAPTVRATLANLARAAEARAGQADRASVTPSTSPLAPTRR
jgi:hypothetical protein